MWGAMRKRIPHYVYVASRRSRGLPGSHPRRIDEYEAQFAGIARARNALPRVLRVTDGRTICLGTREEVDQAPEAIIALTGGSSLRGQLSYLFGNVLFAASDDVIVQPEAIEPVPQADRCGAPGEWRQSGSRSATAEPWCSGSGVASLGVSSQGVSRSGAFWETIEGRRAAPPVARTLGWRLSWVAPERGEIEVNVTAGERFTNSMGNVQGGFLAAMLDDTMGPALVAAPESTSSLPPWSSRSTFCALRRQAS